MERTKLFHRICRMHKILKDFYFNSIFAIMVVKKFKIRIKNLQYNKRSLRKKISLLVVHANDNKFEGFFPQLFLQILTCGQPINKIFSRNDHLYL